MGILHPKDATAAEHHPVFCESSCLVREQVLNLSQVLSDIEGPTLDPGIQLLIVKGQVIVDEVDLTQFHNLNGHIQRNGNQHLFDRNSVHVKIQADQLQLIMSQIR